MDDFIKKEYAEKAKDKFSEVEYWEWINRRYLMSNPLSGNDLRSIKSYMTTQNYSMLTPNAIKVILHCLFFGSGING